jgi:NADPH-dependent glutamate synthase beta subunit-like oxidoreductase
MKTLLPLFLLGASSSTLASPTKGSFLERDVCIIGGGSSGTYAAVRLQQLGKSVALIEQKPRLGGLSLLGLSRSAKNMSS